MYLQKAIQLSAKATSADKEMKYKEAIGLYNLALEYYLHALKCKHSIWFMTVAVNSKYANYL